MVVYLTRDYYVVGLASQTIFLSTDLVNASAAGKGIGDPS